MEKTHETLGSDIGRCQTTSLLIGVQDQPRRSVLSPKSVVVASSAGCGGERTMWLRRFAAPKPVGPAPITRTSTFLRANLSEFTIYQCEASCWAPFDHTHMSAIVENRPRFGESDSLVCATFRWRRGK